MRYLLKKVIEVKNKIPVIFLLIEKIKEIIGLFIARGLSVQIGSFRIPIRLEFRFAISDMVREWGSKHNRGFKAWTETCSKKRVVFDVGAHIGLYSLTACKVVDIDGCVIAFEPAEVNYKALIRHMRFNEISNMRVFPFIVGKEDKDEVLFYESVFPTGMHRKIPLKGYKKRLKRQVTLDTFCELNGFYPEVIKIDVEGGEGDVLKGASGILKKSHPTIFLSIHPGLLQYYNTSIRELLDFIVQQDYRLFNFDGSYAVNVSHNEYIME